MECFGSSSDIHIRNMIPAVQVHISCQPPPKPRLVATSETMPWFFWVGPKIGGQIPRLVALRWLCS